MSFLVGISMLHRKQSLFSACLHGLGSISLAAFMWDGWSCGLFWWIFALTVVLPFLSESYVLIRLNAKSIRRRSIQS
ncbi:hypothetical protein BLOT_006473 [Blomia tropicalis]|nr:hypothetical protein BLOT_006473 [Blomia tropicalis]